MFAAFVQNSNRAAQPTKSPGLFDISVKLWWNSTLRKFYPASSFFFHLGSSNILMQCKNWNYIYGREKWEWETDRFHFEDKT
jgi:hypothetical protein